MEEVAPGHEIRPGTDIPPYWEILQRLPDGNTRLELKHLLSTARFRLIEKGRFARRWNDSYGIFQLFRPSLIANYNHDGLAHHFCGRIHVVLDMHGTIEPGYGSQAVAKLISDLRITDLPDTTDSILMGVPESFFDPHPAQRRFRRQLTRVERFFPDFIAIIGYSFAQNETGYDDIVSRTSFLETHRDFAGNIYVIQPSPDALSAMIADGTRSRNVFPIRAYWNVLAHAFIRMLFDNDTQKTIDYICDQTIGEFGFELAFPLDHD